MMKKNKKLNLNIGIVLLLFLGMIACNKEEKSSLAPMQMFKPGTFEVVSHTADVLVSWSPSLYTSSTDTTVTYTVQISKDSSFQTDPLLEFTTDTTGFKLTDDKIEVRQKYFARVKANISGDRPASGWVTSHGFQIQGIQIMLPKETKVQSNRVQLHWTPRPDIDRIVLVADSIHGFDTTRVDITSSEVAAGIVEISNLSSNTTFHAELYTDKTSVGYANFTTKSAIDGNVVDLSEITGRPEILSDTLSELPDGSVVFLKRGADYVLNSSYNFDKSVTIMSKPGFSPKAHISFESNFDLEDNVQLDSIKFEELILTGDYSSKYVLNVSNPGTVGKIVFNDCDINNFRGVFRIKASDPVTITDVNINNCIIDSIYNYGIMNEDKSAAVVKNFRIKNSTVSNAEITFKGKSDGEDSVLIDHCTFYNTPGSGRYLIRYDSHDVGFIRVNSCILGKVDGAKGYKVGSGSVLKVTNTYTTADYDNAGRPLPNTTLYDQTSDDIFSDPENGDFTIIDSNFPTIGDPRWLP